MKNCLAVHNEVLGVDFFNAQGGETVFKTGR